MAGLVPFSWSTAKNTIHTWLSDQLGISVDFADQERPRLSYPYATYRLLSLPRRMHQDETRWEPEVGGDGVKVRKVGNRVITVSCQAFVSFEGVAYDHDADALHYMSIAQMSLAQDDVLDDFKTAGLYVQDVLDIRDLTGQIDAGWLSRAVLDFQCGLAFDATPATFGDSIGTVLVSSDLDGQQIDGALDMIDEEIGGA